MILSISRYKRALFKAVEPDKQRGGDLWTSGGTMLGPLASGILLCSASRAAGGALVMETGTLVGRVI
jgi:hypothetical protein